MDSESKLISLITQLMSLTEFTWWKSDPDSLFMSPITQIINLVSSMDSDAQPKPESELMSLTTQTISLFKSMDLDPQPQPLRKLISLVSQNLSLVNSVDSYSEPDLDSRLMSLFDETSSLKLDTELTSRIRQIIFVGIFMDSKWKKLISLCPQVHVILGKGKPHVTEVPWSSPEKRLCLPLFWERYMLLGEEGFTHFRCKGCNGANHKEYNKAPLEIKHPLHRKHSLQLVLITQPLLGMRKCYCCDEDLIEVCYYCLPCDFAMSIACVDKPPVFAVDHTKWHEHTLALFPRQTSLTCNVCALDDSSSAIYMCPPCDFVVHQRCISLPHVIRISRHLHRISFTPSFDQGDWSCGVCRKKMENDYGGYSCIRKDCFYAVHSRCATQINVWDGKELEGVPEEEIEEVEPFVTINDGIIQHFSHQHHYLRLDDNTSRDYDENMQCQACVMPIYFGNFYSCMQCDFILHEECAKFSRKLYHPIHPHLLTLVTKHGGNELEDKCSACHSVFRVCFFYECGEEKCRFMLHVQCATISEPLVHESHMHPLFLTSKPEEQRECCVCKRYMHFFKTETFNCIEECDFSLCFKCATLPQKVRYKHDKHMLTLSYGNETSTLIYWCEVCEEKINPKQRFYMCDEYCCVTLHIQCMLGDELYMTHGSPWIYLDKRVCVLPNKHHMSRPICCICGKRCPHKIVLQWTHYIFCSSLCFLKMKFQAVTK